MGFATAWISLFGAFNGALLGGVILLRAPALRSAASLLAGLLLVASVALALITLEHQGWVPRHWWIYAIEETLTLLSGAMLVSFVSWSVRGRGVPGWVWLPVIGYFAAVVVSGGAIQRYLGMEHLVWIQILYSCVAAALFVASLRSRSGRLRPVDRTTGLILVCIFLIHGAQMVRMLFSDPPWVRDVVPLTGTVFFYALLVYALLHSRTIGTVAGAPTASDQSTSLAAFDHIQRHLSESRQFADPSLDLTALAAAVALPPSQVSTAINSATGRTVPEYLAELRVQEAKRLLSDPREARYTVEGIGRQCGFGSRSAFYKAFKARTGLSPAAWRQARQGGSGSA